MKKHLPKYNTLEEIAPPYEELDRYKYFEGNERYPFKFDVSSFDVTNAWWLSEISTLCYSKPSFALPQFDGVAGFNTKYIADNDTGTESYILSNNNSIIVAFRGTEISPRDAGIKIRNIIQDIKTDTDLVLVPNERGKGHVHNGFQKAIKSIWEKVNNEVRELQNKRQRGIWFTGHSLGAAMATLAADRYATNIGDIQGLYTFGSPRVGDKTFSESLMRRVPTYRVVYNRDIVTRVPLKEQGYEHIGMVKIINEKGILSDHPGDWRRLGDKDNILEYLLSGMINNTLRIPLLNFANVSIADILGREIMDHVPIYYSVHLWNSFNS